MADKNFPADFPDLGRGLVDADKLIVNDRSMDASRIRSYTVGAADGSTVGSPWEAIKDTETDVATLTTDALKDADFAGTQTGPLLRTGVSTYAVRKDNMTAVVAPTVTDDTNAGYIVGSNWYDVTADEAYTALDVSAGAAVWKGTTSAGVVSSNLIFAYNRTDQSQFSVISSLTTAANPVNFSTNYFWLESPASGLLKINQGSLVGGGQYMVLPIDPAALLQPLPLSYEIEVHVEGAQSINQNQYFGIMFSWNTGLNTGAGAAISNSSSTGLHPFFESAVELSTNYAGGAGSFMAAFGPQTTLQRGATYIFTIDHKTIGGKTVIGGDHHSRSWWTGVQNDSYRLAADRWYSANALWNTYAPNTIAIYYRAVGAANSDFLIRDIIIRKHPRDCT